MHTKNLKPIPKLKPIPYSSEELKEFRDAIQVLKSSSLSKQFNYVEPVPRAPRLWEQLKNAKSPRAAMQAFSTLQAWALNIRGPSLLLTPNKIPVFYEHAKSKASARDMAKKAMESNAIPAWFLLPFIVPDQWAGQFVRAKKLWTYPRSNRRSSDDKRIEFFAKCFTALTLGKSPATLTARWSGQPALAEKTGTSV